MAHSHTNTRITKYSSAKRNQESSLLNSYLDKLKPPKTEHKNAFATPFNNNNNTNSNRNKSSNRPHVKIPDTTNNNISSGNHKVPSCISPKMALRLELLPRIARYKSRNWISAEEESSYLKVLSETKYDDQFEADHAAVQVKKGLDLIRFRFMQAADRNGGNHQRQQPSGGGGMSSKANGGIGLKSRSSGAVNESRHTPGAGGDIRGRDASREDRGDKSSHPNRREEHQSGDGRHVEKDQDPPEDLQKRTTDDQTQKPSNHLSQQQQQQWKRPKVHKSLGSSPIRNFNPPNYNDNNNVQKETITSINYSSSSGDIITQPCTLQPTQEQMKNLFVETCFFARMGFVQPPSCLYCAYRSVHPSTASLPPRPPEENESDDADCDRLVVWRKNGKKRLRPDNMQDNVILMKCRSVKRMLMGGEVEKCRWIREEKKLSVS